MAKAVVIGANGFLGSHLVDALDRRGHQVTAFDRFSGNGLPRFASPRVDIMRGEFLSRTDLDSAVAGQEFVFHFLSTTTPATAERDPTLDLRTNVAQTIELLESCVESGVRHFYYASTGGAIYGMQGKRSYDENDRTLPVSPYGIGKLTIEHYLRYFATVHGLKSTALRISNPYGTRQAPTKLQGLIPIALRHVLRGEPVIQLGDGSMVRDYVFVSDAVEMITSLVASNPQHDLYNIGTGHGFTVSEVLEAIKVVTGRNFAVEQRPAPATYVDRVVLDTSRYRAEYGDPPTTSLFEGIRLTLDGMEASDDQA